MRLEEITRRDTMRGTDSTYTKLELLESLESDTKCVHDLFFVHETSVEALEQLTRLKSLEVEDDGVYSVTMKSLNEQLGTPTNTDLSVEGLGDSIKKFAKKMWEKIKKVWRSILSSIRDFLGVKKTRKVNMKETVPEEVEGLMERAKMWANKKKWEEENSGGEIVRVYRSVAPPKLIGYNPIDNDSHDEPLTTQKDREENHDEDIVAEATEILSDIEEINEQGIDLQKLDKIKQAYLNANVWVRALMKGDKSSKCAGLNSDYSTDGEDVIITPTGSAADTEVVKLSDVIEITIEFESCVVRMTEVGEEIVKIKENTPDMSDAMSNNLNIVLNSINKETNIVMADLTKQNENSPALHGAKLRLAKLESRGV